MHYSWTPSPSQQGALNNTEEYKAVIVGLELALQILITNLTINDDSQLIVKKL